MQPLRSFLFAPGNHARRVEKALSLDADAVILDLEDAVATAEKRATRDAVIAALARPRRALLYIRVNAVDTEFCYGDFAAIVRPGLDGVILPKVESAAGLATADWLLAQLEREQGLTPRAIDLVPIIETARGLNQIDAILAAGTRVKRVAFGAGDFTLDVNMTWSRGEAELAYVRAKIVTASRAAGIEAPFDTVWVDLADEEGLEASARTALGFGFQGKMCIHPNQIAVVNRVFTPSEAEIAFAERVVAAFARAEAEGSALTIQAGRFVWAESEGREVARDSGAGGLTGIHPTKDGFLYISVHSNHFFAALCELVGRPELARDPRCATMRSRAAHAAELVPELRAALAERSAREWEEIFGEGVPCAAVRPIEDMFDHPQVLAEDLVATLDHPVVGRYRTMTKPIKFADTPGPLPSPSPTFGQHSDEILAAHGYSAAEIAALRDRGAVK